MVWTTRAGLGVGWDTMKYLEHFGTDPFPHSSPSLSSSVMSRPSCNICSMQTVRDLSPFSRMSSQILIRKPQATFCQPIAHAPYHTAMVVSRKRPNSSIFEGSCLPRALPLKKWQPTTYFTTCFQDQLACAANKS